MSSFGNLSYLFDFNSRMLTQISLVHHRIDTGDTVPVRSSPYRNTPVERRAISHEATDMLGKGIILPSTRFWSSTGILVKKKDDSWRFCVDYRRLKKVTVKDVYPMARIDDALDCFQGSAYSSTMDLRAG